MNGSLEVFAKMLVELRELSQKGADADPKKFNALAKSLSWDVKSSFALPLTPEQMEFIKILATSDACGDYWKGYGDALTDFLLPLNRLEVGVVLTKTGSTTSQDDKVFVNSSPGKVESAQPAAILEPVGSNSSSPAGQSKKKFILD